MQPDPRDYEIRIWYSAEEGTNASSPKSLNGPASWLTERPVRKQRAKSSSRSKALSTSLPKKASNRQRRRSRTPRKLVTRHYAIGSFILETRSLTALARCYLRSFTL